MQSVEPVNPAPARPATSNTQSTSQKPVETTPPQSQMSRSDDYRQLVGELQYNPIAGTWRLRYSPVEQEDSYGGVVTLRNLNFDAKELRSGMTVSVQGELIEPAGRMLSPDYRVTEFRVLTP